MMAFRGDLEALILSVLMEGPKHGYEISKKILQLSGKTLRFGEGQLYPTLHKLEEADAVQASWEPQEGKPPRKVYALTEKGKLRLQKKQGEWDEFQKSISAIMSHRADMEAGRG